MNYINAQGIASNDRNKGPTFKNCDVFIIA